MKVLHFRTKTTSIEDIQKLASIHHGLTEVIKTINQIYSTFVMLYFAGIFCMFNLFLFTLVTTKNYVKDPTEAFVSMLTNFEWNFYDVMLVIIVTRATTAASAEGKKTTKFIYKIVNTSMDSKLNGRVSEIGFL